MIDQTALEVHFGMKPKHSKFVKERIERRLSEHKQQNREMEDLRLERSEKLATEEKDKRMKGLKKQRVDELAPEKTEERKEQIEGMDEELEDVLSSLDR